MSYLSSAHGDDGDDDARRPRSAMTSRGREGKFDLPGRCILLQAVLAKHAHSVSMGLYCECFAQRFFLAHQWQQPAPSESGFILLVASSLKQAQAGKIAG